MKIIVDCVICGKTFEGKRSDAKYCSSNCRNKAKKGKTRKHENGSYRRRKYVVNTSSKNGQLDKFKRDFNYFKPCKFDEEKENLYYIHDFNDSDLSSSLIKYTNTTLSEKEFEYYYNRGNLVFYEMLT